jgi:hypothetical protein
MGRLFEHTVSTDQATFLGFGLEAVFYGVSPSNYDRVLTADTLLGINLILFGIAVSVLVGRSRPATKTSKPLLAVTCFMFGLCTTHFALNFNNVYDGLVRAASIHDIFPC